MMRAIGCGAKRAHGLFALAVAAALAADPLLAEAQNNPAPASAGRRQLQRPPGRQPQLRPNSGMKTSGIEQFRGEGAYVWMQPPRPGEKQAAVGRDRLLAVEDEIQRDTSVPSGWLPRSCDVYGWFVPVERGVYALAKSGRAALLRWPQSAPPTAVH